MKTQSKTTLLSLVLLLGLVLMNTANLSAQTAANPWMIGKNNPSYIKAYGSSTYDTLYITGEGAMKDFTPTGEGAVPWKDYLTDFKVIAISGDITTIGNYAFENFSNMKMVSIPESVVSVGSYAFSNCTSLDSLWLPDGIVSFGMYAFQGCTALRVVKIPAEYRGNFLQVFSGCTNVRAMYYYRDIPQPTYDGANLLVAFNNPQEITLYVKACAVDLYRGFYAWADNNGKIINFKDCQAIPGTEDEECACDNGTAGENITWQVCGNVLTIGGSGEMPNWKVTSQGGVLPPWDQFRDAVSVINIGENITNIGDYAFFQFKNLQEINIPSNIKRIGILAFGFCEKLTSATFMEGLDTIETEAFFGSNLSSAYIYNSVKYIGDAAFAYNRNLSMYFVYPDNPNYASHEGVLYNKDTTTLLVFPTAKFGATTYVPNESGLGGKWVTDSNWTAMPNTVKRIYYGAFAYTKLKQLTISENVTYIGPEALAEMHFLDTIHLPDGVDTIGGLLFYNDTNLKVVTIGKGLKSVGGRPFDRCSKLDSIDVHPDNTVLSAQNGVLFNKNKSVLVWYPSGKQGHYIIPETVRSIYNVVDRGVAITSAFAYSKGLTGITIPAHFTRIDTGMFASCSNLKTLVMKGNVEAIFSLSMSGLDSLQDVTCYATVPPAYDAMTFLATDMKKVTLRVPECAVANYQQIVPYSHANVVAIENYECPCYSGKAGTLNWELCTDGGVLTITGNGTIPDYVHTDASTANDAPWFPHRRAIRKVNIGEGVTEIGHSAFEANIYLTSVTMPDNVSRIGNAAFAECASLAAFNFPSSLKTVGNGAFAATALTSVVLPEGVTTIGNVAFANCFELKTVTLPSTVKKIEFLAFWSNFALTDVYNHAVEPLDIVTGIPEGTAEVPDFGVFAAVDVMNATLHVPAGSVEAYRAAPVWQDFKTIEASSVDKPLETPVNTKVYPNPFTDEITIDGAEGSVLRVYNLIGKELHTQTISDASERLNLKALPSGTYVLTFEKNGGVHAVKVVKK